MHTERYRKVFLLFETLVSFKLAHRSTEAFFLFLLLLSWLLSFERGTDFWDLNPHLVLVIKLSACQESGAGVSREGLVLLPVSVRTAFSTMYYLPYLNDSSGSPCSWTCGFGSLV